jgi:hypothetical protein
MGAFTSILTKLLIDVGGMVRVRKPELLIFGNGREILQNANITKHKTNN